MIILDCRLEPIQEPDMEQWVKDKLVAMGFKEVDTVQVNL